MNQRPEAKYRPFVPMQMEQRQWPSQSITKPPQFCAVDLRDGNQALIHPLDLAQRQAYYALLTQIGFKEIEAGFPSASEIDYAFLRWLIEENQLNGGQVPQVLVQSRPALIEKTMQSLVGVKQAIVHLYISTSPVQRKVVLKKSRAEVIETALAGVRQIKEMASQMPGSHIRLEFSPESFSATETDFAVEICQAVLAAWEPVAKEDMIFNLPSTVEVSSPNHYADQIEYFIGKMGQRERWTCSVHPHNDRGTAVAAAELAVMAGADRVEGTLFGNGERTGNLDLITFCMNLFSQGVETGLQMSHLDQIKRAYEGFTGLAVGPRHPYAGDLVYTAFSGSHQDAINKGMKHRAEEEQTHWDVPYLPIDPADVGRSFEAVIRINSQSGKGGVAWVLEQQFGLLVPKAMQPLLQQAVQAVSDDRAQEIEPAQVYEIFKQDFLQPEGAWNLDQIRLTSEEEGENPAQCQLQAQLIGPAGTKVIQALGTGPIDALVAALDSEFPGLQVVDFAEQALEEGSKARAMAYVAVTWQGQRQWGAGVDANISMASLRALMAVLNRLSMPL